MDQYIGDAYHDPVVECARSVLERLDAARDADSPTQDVFAVTHIQQTPSPDKHYWLTSTLYRAEIMGDIHSGLLEHPTPPAYLEDMLGSLVTAHVFYENQRRSRTIPLFSPDKTELAAHVLHMWSMIPDQVREAAEGGEYTLPIHKIGETVLELYKPEASNVWSLNFRHQAETLLMIPIDGRADRWLEVAA